MGSRWFDALSVAMAAAAATSHIYTGVTGLVVHRKRVPSAWAFGLSTAALAWATLLTGLANAVPSVEVPALPVLSTLLSGYGAPALLLFVRQAVEPGRRANLAWLLMGLPGTLFSLRALTDPSLLLFVHQFRAGLGPRWEPRLSPLYLGHGLQLLLCLGLASAHLARGIARAGPGPYRDGLRWIGLAIGIGAVVALAFTLIPGAFGAVGALQWAPLATLPSVALGARGLRDLSVHASAAVVPRADAEAGRRKAVEAAVRGVTGTVAGHLARIDAKLQLFAAGAVPQAEHQALLARLSAQVDEARSLLGQLAGAAGGPSAAVEPVPVHLALTDAVRRAAARGQRVELHAAVAGAWALASPHGLAEALDALLENAAQAGGPPPRLSAWVERPAVLPPDASTGLLDGEDAVCLELCDRGAGMGPEELAQACEPFFTTRPGARGLGLAVVLATVRLAGGAMRLSSSRGEGTTARLWLPYRAGPAVPESPRSMVVLVEDDRVAELIMSLVAARGYPLLRLRGLDDLRVAAAAGELGSIASALLPWRSKDGGGDALVAAMRSAAPGARLVMYGAEPPPDPPLFVGADVLLAPQGAGCATLSALLVAAQHKRGPIRG
jgi:hypothetical protein